MKEIQKMYTVERLWNSSSHVTTSPARSLCNASRQQNWQMWQPFPVLLLTWLHSDSGDMLCVFLAFGQVMKAGVSSSQACHLGCRECLCQKLWITLLTVHANAVVCVCMPSWSADQFLLLKLGQWKRMELSVPTIYIVNAVTIFEHWETWKFQDQPLASLGPPFRKTCWPIFFLDFLLIKRQKFPVC